MREATRSQGRQRSTKTSKPTSASPTSNPSSTLAFQLNAACERLFRRHGRYISRHQIRILLLCSLVITSLFYPAVGIYFWSSKGGPGVTRGDAASVWRSLSTPFMDSFVSSGRKHHNSLRDLRMVWDDAKDLRAIDARDANAMFASGASSTPHPLFPFGGIPSLSSAKGESPPRCRTIRVEHVFVTTDDVLTGNGPRYGVLDTPVLHSALQLQGTIESLAGHTPNAEDFASADKPRCVTSGSAESTQSGGCLTLSPLAYWDLDAQKLLTDEHPAHTLLTSSLNRTAQGVPASITTTLAGRWHLFKKLPRAEHLALTFFLEDNESSNECISSNPADEEMGDGANEAFSPAHVSWLRLLSNVTAGQVSIIPSEHTVPKELLLQFRPSVGSSPFAFHRILLGIGYAVVTMYISRGLVKMRKVHSRFGLAFTGSIELIISMILSVSICALLGIRLTLVPWEILPFVIVVVGSENMFALTNAIVNTPLSLTVPARIAQGLSKVGVSITVTVLSDILLLSIITSVIGVRAVREFCIFAICSLVMDYFMQMTFFVTVLSIDMQRLELADLLTQGSRNARDAGSCDNSERSFSKRNQKKIDDGPNSFIKTSCRAVWRARTARTASLSLLLAFMFGLYIYYGTGYPSTSTYPYAYDTPGWLPTAQQTTEVVNQGSGQISGFDPYAHLGASREASLNPSPPWWAGSPSATFWQALNPQGAAQVRILVEPWTILSLRSTTPDMGGHNSQTFAGWALFRPRIRAIVWFLKVVVLPIAGTTGLLWVTLLYLLKDTDLLDAQRDKSEPDSEDGNQADANGPRGDSELPVDLYVSRGKLAADVDFLAESDGVVVTADLHGRISVWQPVKQSAQETSLKILLRGPDADSSPVTALALSALAGVLVIGQGSGRVSMIALGTLKLICDERARSPRARPESAVQHIALHAREGMEAIDRVGATSIHRDGSAWEWLPGESAGRVVIPARPESSWTAYPVALVPMSALAAALQGDLLVLVDSNGQLEVRQRDQGSNWRVTCTLQSTARGSFRSAALAALDLSNRQPPGSPTAVFLTGSSGGVLHLWNYVTAQPLTSVDLADGPVHRIRLVSESEFGTTFMIAMTSTRVSILRLGPNSGSGTPQAGAGGESNVSASYSFGSVSSIATSPTKSRAPSLAHLAAPSFWTEGYFPHHQHPHGHGQENSSEASYPISPHRSRFRRMSGQGSQGHGQGREGSVSGSGAETPIGAAGGGAGREAALASTPVSALAIEAGGDQYFQLIGRILAHRGGADVLDETTLVGIRRRRTGLGSGSGGGARTTRLGGGEARWEVWKLDLAEGFGLGFGHGFSLPTSRQNELAVKRTGLDLDRAATFRDPSAGASASTSASWTVRARARDPSTSSNSTSTSSSSSSTREKGSRGSESTSISTNMMNGPGPGPGPEPSDHLDEHHFFPSSSGAFSSSFGPSSPSASLALAFTRLSPVQASVSGRALVFGFGNSVGLVRTRNLGDQRESQKEDERERATATERERGGAARDALGERTTKRKAA